jgi:uncharacterized membrane protein YoaK (UPF0700 family)
MLPFDSKPWAKPLAATIIVLTVLAALVAPFYLHHIRHLDPPMAVLILLLVLAIVPPNLVILRRHAGEAKTAPVVHRRNGLVTH